MDLVETLRKKIDILDDGDYLPGLKAVLLHIETAFRHLSRGQEADDDTAFTDAIYRTNQAFEGSVKEAYRVLTGQDPAKKRPYDIEKYLEQNNIFRSRVLSQLTTYRSEWRNPSTHDYKLDFDESEAFLAIISVSAFSCLLLDQIAERLAYIQSQSEAEAQKVTLELELEKTVNADLLVRVIDLLRKFCAIHLISATHGKTSEAQVIGALHGFFASVAPDLEVQTEARLDGQHNLRPDFVVIRQNERLVIELKRTRMKQGFHRAVTQVTQYLLAGGIKNGIVLFLPDGPSEMEMSDIAVHGFDGKIAILTPVGFTQLENYPSLSVSI